MTDTKEPALAYTAVGEMTFCRPSTPDARKTLSELGKEEEAMPITGPHDKPD